MKYKEVIDEYQLIDKVFFKTSDFDFSKSKTVGKIMTKIGLLQVKENDDGEEIVYGAFQKEKNICVLGFLKAGEKILIAKNAVIDPENKQQGIASELFYFVNKVMKNKIISDTQLTNTGEMLWKSLIKSSKFDPKIFYIPSKEIFELSEIGQKTSDGETIILPEKDNFEPDFYDETTKKGQKFFYILESQIPCTKTHEKISKSKLLLPYPIFNDDQERL